MNWITIKWNTVSKLTGERVDFGLRAVHLVDKRTAWDYQYRFYKHLTEIWPVAAYETTIKYEDGINTNLC